MKKPVKSWALWRKGEDTITMLFDTREAARHAKREFETVVRVVVTPIEGKG